MRSHLQLVSSVAENPDPKQLGEPCVCVRQWSRDHDFQPWKVPKPMSGLSLLRHENISQHILRTYACILCMRIRPVPKIFPLQIWLHRPYLNKRLVTPESRPYHDSRGKESGEY